MQKILVPADLLQATVNYLAGRPFGEVHELIPALINCPTASGDAREEEQKAPQTKVD